MNEKAERKTNDEKGRIKMAIFTAVCDRTFIVSPNKAEEFKSKKADKNVSKKIVEAKEKFKNIKAE